MSFNLSAYPAEPRSPDHFRERRLCKLGAPGVLDKSIPGPSSEAYAFRCDLGGHTNDDFAQDVTRDWTAFANKLIEATCGP